MLLCKATRLAACATVLLLAGCPLVFVQVPEGAESILPTQATETSRPEVAGKPVFSTRSVVGGLPVLIDNQLAICSTDRLLSIDCSAEGATISHALGDAEPDAWQAAERAADSIEPRRD